MKAKNILHIEHGFGWFIGNFEQNQLHKHYALQLNIPLVGLQEFEFNKESFQTDQAVLVASNIEHRLSSSGDFLTVLFNPASSYGHYWNQFVESPYTLLTHRAVDEIKMLGDDFLRLSHTNKSFLNALNLMLKQYNCSCTDFLHQTDQRIENALAYLHERTQEVVSLKEIAAHCNLSADRFQHLFKTSTGLTYRRAQLWTKIMYALPLLGKQSLTSIAHEAGFADSAHFSRTFKENFGISPRDLIKVSQFIQV